VHLRVAPEALARGVSAGVLAACLLALACTHGARDVGITWKIEPTPPVTDTLTVVRLTLQHADGRMARDARLRLEAHMTHPGMAPLVADVTDRGNGAYDARVQLSMAGDWVFVVSGVLADGTRITKETRVPAVRSGR
jgi:hypothetical protein